MNPRDLLTLAVILLTCVFHLKILCDLNAQVSVVFELFQNTEPPSVFNLQQQGLFMSDTEEEAFLNVERHLPGVLPFVKNFHIFLQLSGVF